MKITLERVSRRYPFELTEIDVSTNSELEKTYGSEIPVLMIEGQKTAHYYIREEELLQKLSEYYSWNKTGAATRASRVYYPRFRKSTTLP